MPTNQPVSLPRFNDMWPAEADSYSLRTSAGQTRRTGLAHHGDRFGIEPLGERRI